jgi:hypothetical protein
MLAGELFISVILCQKLGVVSVPYWCRVGAGTWFGQSVLTPCREMSYIAFLAQPTMADTAEWSSLSVLGRKCRYHTMEHGG